MALLSHTLTISYQGDGSTVSVPVKTLTGDAQLAYDNIIADGVTNGEIDLVFGFATVKMMILTSDQAMTVKTNSTSAPDDTIALGANIPVIFYTGGPVSIPVKTLTGDAQLAYDNIIADGVTNGEIDLVFGFAAVRMMILVSDQAMTVKTNSTSAPDDTIALGASIPVIFYTGGPVSWTNPFSVNVTKFYVTNASGKPSRLRFRALIDASPVLPDTAA